MTVIFQDNLCKLAPETQTILDFIAARDDGNGISDSWNSLKHHHPNVTSLTAFLKGLAVQN